MKSSTGYLAGTVPKNSGYIIRALYRLTAIDAAIRTQHITQVAMLKCSAEFKKPLCAVDGRSRPLEPQTKPEASRNPCDFLVDLFLENASFRDRVLLQQRPFHCKQDRPTAQPQRHSKVVKGFQPEQFDQECSRGTLTLKFTGNARRSADFIYLYPQFRGEGLGATARLHTRPTLDRVAGPNLQALKNQTSRGPCLRYQSRSQCE